MAASEDFSKDLSLRMKEVKKEHEAKAAQEEIYGIDVSHHNGDINWKRVTKSPLNLKFVFMKATEGRTFVSPKFAQNWAEVSRTKLIKGAYHYYRTDSDPAEQAKHFLNVLLTNKFNKEKDLYALDVEVNPAKQESKTFSENLKVFIQTMQAAGFTTKPYFYTTKSFWEKNLGSAGAQLLSENNLWIARWYKDTGQVPPPQPTPGELPQGANKWMIWQFTSKGKIQGISKEVDINLCREASLIKSVQLAEAGEQPIPLPCPTVSSAETALNIEENSPTEGMAQVRNKLS